MRGQGVRVREAGDGDPPGEKLAPATDEVACKFETGGVSPGGSRSALASHVLLLLT